MHGNNKGDDELRAAAEAGARFVVVDALDEIERAAGAGVGRVLVRVTPGIDADTHAAIRTAHHGSKFGLPPDQAAKAIAAGREAGLDVAGLHLHIGSQLLDTEAAKSSIDWLGAFAADCRAELGWVPSVVDLGGGLGIQYVEGERPPAIAEFVGTLLERLDHAWTLHGLPRPDVILEPGRSLVGHAAVTLYRVGVVKQATESTTYVAIDGGMSDNPRPQLYGARYEALLANRADEEPSGAYTVCGKHCESGDVLIDSVQLPEPRRGDLLAVPGTGAYTLAMGSNYNAVPRPAAVLVSERRGPPHPPPRDRGRPARAGGARYLNGGRSLSRNGFRGFWLKLNSRRQVAEHRHVLADRRPRVGPPVRRRVEPQTAEEVVLDELGVGVEAQDLVVDEAAPRVRRDQERGHPQAVAVLVDRRRHDVVVETAPVVPREEDRAGGPVRTSHDRVDHSS